MEQHLSTSVDEPALIKEAWAAHHARDWPTASGLWARVRERDPTHYDGYFGGAAALIALNELEDAALLSRAGLGRWPKNLPLLIYLADAEFLRGQAASATRTWARARSQHPDDLEAYEPAVRRLTENGLYASAVEVLNDRLKHAPQCRYALTQLAEIQQAQGLYPNAAATWAELAKLDPDALEPKIGQAEAFRKMGRFAEASRTIAELLDRPPLDDRVAELSAELAFDERRFEDALGLWAQFQFHFPDRLEGYVRGAETLVTMGRSDEAVDVLKKALGAFPSEPAPAIALIRILERRGHWTAAVSEWRTLAERFHRDVEIECGLANALSRNERSDEADDVLRSAIARRPKDPKPLWHYAEIAAHRRQWDEAERRWTHMVQTFPDNSPSWIGLFDLYVSQGKLNEAGETITKAEARLPENPWIAVKVAVLVTLRHDWDRAEALWSALKERFPHNPAVLEGLVEFASARLEIAPSEPTVAATTKPDERPSIVEPTASTEPPAPGNDNLFLRFESIGLDCEFGFVQRHFGAEPLSLLRWTTMPLASLIYGMEFEWKGIDDPDLNYLEDTRGEYMLHNRRYQSFSHTAIKSDSSTAEAALHAHLKRIWLLRRKLLSDLRLGNRFYVFKCPHNVREDDILHLLFAIKKYHPQNKLIFAGPASDAETGPMVVEKHPGLFNVALIRYSVEDPSYSEWGAVCQRVVEMCGVDSDVTRAQ